MCYHNTKTNLCSLDKDFSMTLTAQVSQVKTIYLRDYQVPEFIFDKVDLEFELNEEYTLVKSRMDVRRNSASKATHSPLILNGEELTLESVSINKNLLSSSQFQITDEFLTIHQIPDQFELQIQVKIKPQENKALSGLYRTGKHFCTQCEAQGFRRITYFLDRPDVLSSYTTTITADKKQYPILLSNGNPIASGQYEDGRHWVRWEDPFKKPCYLFALVAGDFDLLEDSFTTASGRQVALRIYVEKGYRDKSFHAMQAVKKAMKWDEENYGREYDLDIYMIVGADDFNMGAMENKGLNIFNTKNLIASPETATDDDYIYIESVIAHEYFHNWTGNRITCRDWFQLSIKEGMTIFRDQSFTEDTVAKVVARIRDVNALRTRQFPEDAGPLAHPVRPESYVQIDNFYTSTVYNKGAEVARMLRTLLGRNLFRQGMDLYFKRHDGQAVTIEEFVKVMEEVSGLDLKQFRLWYSQAGTPCLDVSAEYEPNAKTYTLNIKQMIPATPGQAKKLPMYIPIKTGLCDESGNALEFQFNGETTKEVVLVLKDTSQAFVLEGVATHPIPSLLRGFSAPVKMHFNYSDKDLAILFKHDSDGFNRWEAGQKYAEHIILSLVKDYQQHKLLKLNPEFVSVWKELLQHMPADKFLLSQMLTLPSERYLAESVDVIDIDAIHAVREFVSLELAQQLKDHWQSLYQQLHDPRKPYHYEVNEVGQRQLKNLCLHFLMLLTDSDIHEKYGMQQFKDALPVNMTDTIGALRCLVNIGSTLKDQALQEFYATWHHQPLIVDKWLTMQAVSKLEDTLPQVEKLLQHPAFDLKNPNKVYSLIGAFAQQNLSRFHSIDGSGYKFLTACVLQLNQFNPIVAARMVKPLTEWRRYDKKRQSLMKAELEVILQQKKLSKDVYELVSKSLIAE
jgi:aminopeptidase N